MEDTTTLFVWGFDSEVEELEIYDLIYYRGGTSLVSVAIDRDENHISLRRARAIFRNPEHAKDAMVVLSNLPLNRNIMGTSMEAFPQMIPEEVIENLIYQNQGSTSLGRNPLNREFVGQSSMGDVANQRYEEIREGREKKLILYVGNFCYELNETWLRNLFLPFGEVSSCTIRRDKVRGKSRGDGFVHFLTTEDAERAATSLNGQMVNGRKIYVSFAEAKTKV